MLATTSRARRPSPNQKIWRRATPPPARPTLSEASVVALSATRLTVAPSRGQSTFWSRRRSIPTIESTAEGGEGDFLEEDRAEDLLGDGRRRRATVPTTLDQHHHHHLRILQRREGG